MILDLFRKVYKYYISGPVKAHRLFNKLTKQKNNDEAYLIASYQIGDIIYSFAYVNALCERLKGEGKRLVVYLADNRKDFLSLYDFDFEVRYWNHNDSNMMVSVQMLNFLPRYVLKGIKNDIYTAIAPAMLKDQITNKRDCLSIIKEDMFFVPNARIDYPHFPDNPVMSIPDLDATKDRIAVINQYSNALKDRLDVFDEISEYLVDKGYVVYSNVVKGQIPAKGSKPLNCSIFEFYNICNQIPLVVSIRSGIIDLAISANTRFFVIYPERRLHDGFFNIYTLKAWQTNNVIEEAIHVNNESTMNQFVSFVNLNNL